MEDANKSTPKDADDYFDAGYASIKVMVVDDEIETLEDFSAMLEIKGFGNIVCFRSATKALEYLEKKGSVIPDIIISDISMPEDMDGKDFRQKLKESHEFCNIPFLFLSAKSAATDKIAARKHSPNYFSKDGNREELVAMICSIIDENNLASSTSPLTRLPGNTVIERIASKRIKEGNETGTEYSLYYIDCDHFKEYNDAYGLSEGDKAIREVAYALKRALTRTAEGKYFLGHFGGDDFMAIVYREIDPEKVCKEIVNEMEKVRVCIYAESDFKRKYFVAHNRQGVQQQFPLMTVSIGVLWSKIKPLSGWGEASNLLAEVKKKAKSIDGDSFFIDKRKEDKGTDKRND